MYNGYLIKIANTVLSYDFIRYGSYTITPDQRQDLDSFRDTTGVLHRNVLPHTASKIEFETVEMPEVDKVALIDLISSNFANTLERKISLEYYDPDTSTYKTGTFYNPVPEYNLNGDRDGILWYAPIRIAFIEY